MDVFFRTDKEIIKMKDKLQVERGYLTTSSLNGQNKYPLFNYKNEEKALKILNQIDEILDKAIEKNASGVSIRLKGDKNE